MTAAAGTGALAAARGVFYDPFFGNDGETVTSGPDGRVYFNGAGATLIRNSNRVSNSVVTPTSPKTFSVDTSPQLGFGPFTSVHSLLRLKTSTTIYTNNRVYGLFGSTAANYYCDLSPADPTHPNNGFSVLQIGYTDGTGGHALTIDTLPSYTLGDFITLELNCRSGTLVGSYTPDGGSVTSISVFDGRYSSGGVGFTLWTTDQQVDTLLYEYD